VSAVTAARAPEAYHVYFDLRPASGFLLA